jgi:hypothetical protein
VKRERIVTFRVASGILKHRRRIGASVWVFLWLIDRVTKEIPDGSGDMDGLVFGGAPVSARRIGDELQDTARTVQSHISRLIREGYIRRTESKVGDASGFVVRKSKKWTRTESADTTEKISAPQDVVPDPMKKVAHPAKEVAGGAQISSRTSQVSSELIRKDIQDIQETNAAPLSETLENGQTLRAFAEEVATLHPRCSLPGPTADEVEKAIQRVARKRNISLSAAAVWIRGSVLAYAASLHD